MPKGPEEGPVVSALCLATGVACLAAYKWDQPSVAAGAWFIVAPLAYILFRAIFELFDTSDVKVSPEEKLRRSKEGNP